MNVRTTQRFELAEGVRYVDGRVVFVDILAGRLYETTPDFASVELLLELDVTLGAVAPVAGRRDTWLAAAGDGFGIVQSGTSEIRWLDRPEASAPIRMRMNDGVCDPTGRFWAGSMAFDGSADAGSLYRVEADGSVEKVLSGVTIPNGPAFSPDGRTMYLADSAKGTITSYELDPVSGQIRDSRLLTQIESDAGTPDGMVVDPDGDLYVAMWGGAKVRRYRREGTTVEDIALPAVQPTSPCLVPYAGGAALVVATAWHALDEPSAADGALHRASLPPSVQPSPTVPFVFDGT